MKLRNYIALLLGLCSLHLTAQVTVKGTITSAEDGEALIGATLLEKGTDSGTATDFDGKYELTVANENAVLIVSYTGLETKEITVGSQTNIDITLNPNASVLEEVVVVGYGTEKRSNISGSVSTITAEEISETPILRPEQALQGRVSGVQVTQNSGSPGSGLNVRIRGVGSIGDSNPLFIVDGVPVDGMDFLNPSDIATMNVLKDAASTAIYGSRGANGVVLITTKEGKKNQAGKVSYEAYYGNQSPWKKVNLLNAREYAILSNEAHIAAGKTPLPEFMNPDAMGEGTDWLAAIFQDAGMTNHQLSISGGGDKSTYLISGSYFDQDGIIGGEKSNFNRYTVRLNGTNQVKDWLTAGTRINFTHLNRKALPENSEFVSPLVRALNMDPVTPIRKFDGTYAYSIYSDTDIVNPVNAIENTYDNWETNRVVGAVFAEAKIIEGLSIRTSYSVDATFAKQSGFVPLFNLSSHPVINDAPAGEQSAGKYNSLGVSPKTWKTWQWENFLTYDKTIGENHHFKLVVGNTILDHSQEEIGAGNINLASNNAEDAFVSRALGSEEEGSIASQTGYQWKIESALLSYFGRLNYEFADKYLFSASIRRDGSSKFGANNRFGYFPSFSAGWKITGEEFFNVEAISFLKLRASWGQNGINNIGDYRFSSLVNQGQNYTFGTDETITNGAVPLRAANPDLKWETVTQSNVGLDLELFDGQINMTTDYFIKETTDMLYEVPIPFIAGTLPPAQNVASMDNKGWELGLSYRNRETAFKYSVGGNITFIQNEVTDLGANATPLLTGRIQSANAFASKTDVGQPIASFFGYVTDGIFQTQQEVTDHAFQNELTAPGDIRFKDLNNDGMIDENDQTYIGNPTPDFTYGITADASYKGFDFSVFFQGTQGNEIYNGTVRYDFTYVNRPNYVLNRWTGPGTSDFEPRVNLNDPNQNARVSDRFVEDGSYLRLKNIQLGYNLPSSILKKIKFDKFRIYVSAQNLMTWTTYSGHDPEIGVIGDPGQTTGRLEIGIDRGFYPQARVLLGGVNITF